MNLTALHADPLVPLAPQSEMVVLLTALAAP